MLKANEAEFIHFLSLLVISMGSILFVVAFSFFVADRFFKRKGRK